MTDRATVLVVDDTRESLQLLTEILTADGYKVRPADSGELALASVAVRSPELILLDIRMPGMGGFEVCRRLKAREESRDTPIVFISAATEVEERVEGLRLGAVDFISKPFHREELLARVRIHLELSRLRNRLENRVAERTVELRVANEQLQGELAARKLAEAERDRLFEEARAANRAKDQFLAVLSHELRNPLAAIAVSVELLRRSGAFEEPRTKHALNVIEGNTKLQARLVNDLLDLSGIVQGKLTLKRVPVQLDPLVRSAVEAFGSVAAAAKISLQTHLTPGVWVHGDVDRLHQILMNLISNAVKFTLPGGTVMVALEPADGWARILVEDTGIGIEASQLSSLFQMFQQGNVGGRRVPGLGIGLALVKSLTERHAGRVRAESTGPGRGSRFTVELPLIQRPTVCAEHRPSGCGRKQIRVLVVEDNPDTRAVLAETLTMLAYQVLPAESGEEALALLAREPVDVILADIGLPGMDGYQFIREVRRLPSAARLPAFAVTGYGQDSDVRRACEAGFVGHFVKPFALDTLDQHIRESLGVASGVAP